MSKKNNYKDQIKVDDYQMFCDQCGMICWASKSQVLDKNTGKGGLRVCPVCVDKIDYGLIPYKIPAEKPIPDSRINQTDTTTGRAPVDFSTFDPLSGDLS
jgi:hypothetical protein